MSHEGYGIQPVSGRGRISESKIAFVSISLLLLALLSRDEDAQEGAPGSRSSSHRGGIVRNSLVLY